VWTIEIFKHLGAWEVKDMVVGGLPSLVRARSVPPEDHCRNNTKPKAGKSVWNSEAI
jgi:hypothetical protein